MRLPKQLQLTVILVNVFGSRQHGFLRRRTLSIDCRLVNRALRSLDQGIRRERKQLLKTKRNRDREISDQFKEIPLAIGASKENEERGRRREIFSLLQQPLKQVLSASISLSLSLSLSLSIFSDPPKSRAVSSRADRGEQDATSTTLFALLTCLRALS